MARMILFVFLIFFFEIGFAQHDLLVFRKGNRTISIFLKDSYIAFQLEGHQWIAGYITRIQNDTFYLKPLEVIYGMFGNDTLATEIMSFVVSDVYAIPKTGVQIDYKNGSFQISKSGGHVHWYWIKSGWIFRVLGAGYATLVVTNGLIQNNLSLSGSKLGVAAAVFLFGELLHLSYKPYIQLGKKYHLEYLKITKN
jgi:hypothetical protein